MLCASKSIFQISKFARKPSLITQRFHIEVPSWF